MLAIASAILVSLPVGFALADHAIDHVTVNGGEVVNAGLEAAATVTDIVLLDTFTTYDRVAIHNAPEQLVEGHTVFLTIEIPIVPNVTNWTFEIIGDVSCEHHVEGEGSFFAGLPLVPRRIDEAHVECRAGETVIVTPDPFYDSSNTYQTSAMQPTGNVVPFEAPSGESGVATEYVYELLTTNWLGETTTQTMYAWSVPVLDPWMHTDGRTKSWYCPLPLQRIEEMGTTSFSVRLDDGSGPAPASFWE